MINENIETLNLLLSSSGSLPILGIPASELYTISPSSGGFLSDKEVSKKVLKKRSPQLSKSDIDIMVDGGDNNIIPLFNNLNSVPGAATIFSPESKNKAARESQSFPLPTQNLLFTEAKSMKTQVVTSLSMLSNLQSSLLEDLVRLQIQLATVLPAIGILSSPLSFNVPGSISMLVLVIDMISNISKTIQMCLPYLDGLKFLEFITDGKSSNPLLKSIEILIQTLISIFKICKSLKSLIDALLKLIPKFSNKRKCEKQKRKYRRKKRKLIKELKGLLKDIGAKNVDNFGNSNLDKPYLSADKKEVEYFSEKTQKNETTQEFIFPALEQILNTLQASDDDKEEIIDIAEEIKSYDDRIKIACNLPDEIPELGDLKITEYDGGIEFEESDISNILKDIKNISDGISSGVEKYVYDVELPDGKILKDLNLDDVEELQEKFNVIFKSNENLNQ